MTQWPAQKIRRNLIVVKPAVGFTLPWAGASPCTLGRMKRRCGASRLLELFGRIPNSTRFIFGVILSAAKDLDGRSDDRRQLRSKINERSTCDAGWYISRLEDY